MPSTDEEKELPKLFKHCVSLYEAMDAHAVDRSDGRAFIGVVSKLVTDELDLAQSYQSKIINRLRAMGSIILYKRGGGNSPSIWLLSKTPTIEDFDESDNTGDKQILKEQERQNILMQRISDLTDRIKKIEEWAMDQGAPI